MKIIIILLLLFHKKINCTKYLDDDSITSPTATTKCEPLNTNLLNMCTNIPYNQTRYPNFMKQKNQQEAANDVIYFLPLVRINCSPVLKLFLCTLYAPPCIENYTTVVKPCRELCEQARSGCNAIVKSFNVEWPDYFNCQKFPSFSGSEACIMDQQQQQQLQQQQPPQSLGPFLPSLLQQFQQQQQNTLQTPSILYDPTSTYLQNPFLKPILFQCPPELKIIDSKKNYYLIINEELIYDCGMPCNKTLFNSDEIQFSRTWILVWSSLCFSSTLFTILTFLIETSRLKYPERPIIFLSACYMIVSLAYLIGSSNLKSNQLICQTQKTQSADSTDFLIQGTEYYPCTILFMMIYFFGMSSSIWWVVLTLTWFLAAGLKWGHEAIESISSYFHLIAWSLPAIKMISILALKKVDADILSGICYTGITNMNILRGFVLAPLVFYLIMGTCFLFAGFVSLFRIRNVMQNEGNKTDKLEKFMVRIGIFSILYMIPAIIVICCYFYEQKSYSQWIIDLWLKKNYPQYNTFNANNYLTQLFTQQTTPYVDDTRQKTTTTSFIFTLYMVKYSMLLIVGITSGFWIWSKKTITSWNLFFSKIFHCFHSMKSSFKHEAAV
jgi:frizzled protein 1/7